MNKFLLATAAVAALTVSVPASAQVGDLVRQGLESLLGGGGSRGATDPRLGQLDARVQASYQRGELSQPEAARLQAELRAIADREYGYRDGGMSQAERNDIQRRVEAVEGRFEQASYGGNRDRDDDRYDRADRDDRYERDSRDDRDDRWSDNERRTGRGCPPGLARKDNGCQPPGQAMRQGERHASQYARVPARFGERYRDTQRHLYRYHDGRIYQLDRRTGRVVKVTATARR